MRSNFEFMTNLQYEVKSLRAQLADFMSGKKYTTLIERQRLIVAEKDSVIRNLNYELSRANSALVTMRENWFQVSLDMEKEHEKKLKDADKKLKQMEERALRAERKLDETKEKLTDKNKELYAVLSELEEERGKNQKLTAQINRNYENSSTPSSQKPNHKKITNNREKTGRKPGGQPGHKGHGRQKHEPDNIYDIPVPEKFTSDPDYYPTGNIISKQVINIHIGITCDEYRTPEYRNKRTGVRVHADFPEGAVNDVNYGGSVKAFAFLLNNNCFVSIDKTRDLLSEITGGKLNISKGMINGLSKEFSYKTADEQKKAFADILLSPAMNVDFSNARLSGKNVPVLVCATPEITLYFARESKGHEGVKGTPIEDYMFTLIHDHDITFYSYGGAHQECLVHILRYLVGSMENEKNLTWNRQMWELIREMIHYRNSVPPDAKPDEDKAKEYETMYHEILEKARDEYEYEPPSDYYKEGFNLYRRLEKYKDSHLLFLYDLKVPSNNNLAERLLRVLKRKTKQVMTFRSFENIAYLCDCMGVIDLLSKKDQNLFEQVSAIFN